MTSVSSSPVVPAKPRLGFIDNLRWVMILLVVSMHAAVTYSHLGSWYFMEDPKPGLALTALFATYQVWLQAFFMGLLFFIAGYFVPGAFERKGPWKFLSDRTIRLGLPALLYMLVIHPLTVYWLLREFAQPSSPALSQAYWPYLSSGRVLSGSGPMWFTLALLGFSLVYALIKFLAHTAPRCGPEGTLPSHAQVIRFWLVMAGCTFLVRTVQPMGTNVFNMQLCFFSQYILLFAAGIRAGQRNWLLRIPFSFGARWLTLALTVGAAAWIGFLAAVILTKSEDKISGGWTWQSAALSIWESFFCVGMCLGLLVSFRDKFNRQGALARWFSDNSFAVYMFHTPLLIAVTLALRPLAAPKPLKFLCATALGSAVTLLASSLVFRRIPGLKRIL